MGAEVPVVPGGAGCEGGKEGNGAGEAGEFAVGNGGEAGIVEGSVEKFV